MELEMWLGQKTSTMPPQVGYIANLKAAGAQLSYSDYLQLSALAREDLITWNLVETRVREEAASSDH